MAGDGRLTDRDVAPVFEVLNDTEMRASPPSFQEFRGWNYYAMIALAQLPEGAGIPSLVQIVEGQDPAASGSGRRLSNAGAGLDGFGGR
jgi:hypothetical protein